VVLEDRICELEDIDAILQAKARFVERFDEIVNARSTFVSLDELTTEDVVWESGHFGVARGRHQFHELLERYRSRVKFSLQFLAGHDVQVQGGRESALGDWTVWQPLTLDRQPWIMAGRFHDSFVRCDEQWRINHVRLTEAVLAPWDTGWHEPLVSPEWPDTL